MSFIYVHVSKYVLKETCIIMYSCVQAYMYLHECMYVGDMHECIKAYVHVCRLI